MRSAARRDSYVQPRRRSKRAKGVASLDARFNMRLAGDELAAWERAARLAGYLGVSDWMRDVGNAAARRLVLASSARNAWNTPPEILIPIVHFLGGIDLDPCSNEGSIVPARVAWILARDGDSLERPWAPHARTYVNPPFGRALPKWIEKIHREAAARPDAEIVLLVPARVDTQWWQIARELGDAAILRGRLAFLDPDTGEQGETAPFPCALLYYGPRREEWRRAWRRRASEILPAKRAA